MAEALPDKLGLVLWPEAACAPPTVSSLTQLPLPGLCWHRGQERVVRVVMAHLTCQPWQRPGGQKRGEPSMGQRVSPGPNSSLRLRNCLSPPDWTKNCCPGCQSPCTSSEALTALDYH